MNNIILTIFGASGDLTKRKLVPSLYELYKDTLLPPDFKVLGLGRTKLSDNEFRDHISEFLPADENINIFLDKLHYLPINPEDTNDYSLVTEKLDELGASKTEARKVFYLSTPPKLYGPIACNLDKSKLAKRNDKNSRVIIEKPFGVDLGSARKLNKQLLQYLHEEQIYRIDHYLGKESVQNLLVTRFSNGIFEPIWNRNFIESVEITSCEALGVEKRGGYYDHAGALRDMVQNHLLQLVSLAAMEPPTEINATSIRNETLKVIQSLRPLSEQDIKENIIRGQYISSNIKGKQQAGYREEYGVDSNSRTETYLAMKFYIDNWRWADVPFYLRTGKKLPTRVTEIVINFKRTPLHLFGKNNKASRNQLILRIQPDEGILLKFGMKVPGGGFNVQTVNMDFRYSQLADIHMPTAYARLLLDCFQGDATLYTRGDAIEESWKFVQPIIDCWKTDNAVPIYGYPAGTWGPEQAERLREHDEWRYPCKNLTSDGDYCEL
ncbi:MAG: glucose-6-phosphate dehydrogenase [Bacteroidales bacterium]